MMYTREVDFHPMLLIGFLLVHDTCTSIAEARDNNIHATQWDTSSRQTDKETLHNTYHT